MLVARKYVKSHVDVEDFKTIYSGSHKELVEKAKKKKKLKDFKRKKNSNGLGRDVPRLQNINEYTL